MCENNYFDKIYYLKSIQSKIRNITEIFRDVTNKACGVLEIPGDIDLSNTIITFNKVDEFFDKIKNKTEVPDEEFYEIMEEWEDLEEDIQEQMENLYYKIEEIESLKIP